MPDFKWLTHDLLRDLSTQARASPRKRKNHNIHAADDAPCQRLLNAVEPDSYIPPHRHLAPGKEETLLVLAGRVGILFFDEQGRVTGDAVLDPAANRFGLTVPAATYHSLVSLAPGTVFFEAKAGPYRPLAPEERAGWAPLEGDPSVPAYLATLVRRFA